MNNIKSFSNLKKFTIVSVLGSIILLFLPWVGEISPINIVEMKNEFFDIVDFKDVPFILNLFSNLGYITIFFLLFTIFKIYKSSYNFASILQFINIVILVLLVSSNIFYAGEYEDSIEDHIEELKEDLSNDEKNEMEEDLEDFFDDYGIEDVFDDHGIKELYEIFRFTPILFLILFITNWILIGILSRRKRLESIK
ncbi:MAG: hypothetical protein HOO15_00970 [Flavobacteriales bacterium]|nr:hypothetical protein [Flavobacteriales bacterium]